ncbi:MAG: replication initiator protein [Microviridae sp.]|nr:MAG: replication initiator protein [Microviridae sp.]
MCLTPSIIVNPKFVKEHNTYAFGFMNGREYNFNWSCHAPFPYDLINKRRFGVTLENLDKFVACDISGDCIPVFISVPCGRCLECIRSRRNQLFSRMVCEQYSHGDIPAIFFTLTYNEANLPSDKSVSVDDVRMFFNRFYLYLRREGYDTDSNSVRHIYFSEYCPSSGRPHYHGMIFGLDTTKAWPFYLNFVDWLEKCWGKGFVHAKHFQPRGFKYVCKYLLKDSNVPEGRKPNFWCGSRVGGGIGTPALACSEFVHQALHSKNFKMTLCVNGQLIKFTLPKFLRDKLLPSLRALFPEEVIHRIKRLSRNLALYHAYRSAFGSAFCQFDFDYVFPPNLAEKFPWFSYMYDDSIEKAISCIDVNHINNDIFAIESSIIDDQSFLDDYTFDLSRIQDIVITRERKNSLYAAYVLTVMSRQAPPPDRESILKYREELLKLNIHPC